MKHYIHKISWFVLAISIIDYSSLIYASTPKLTVVMIVDQLSYNKLASIKSYLQYGIHTLMDQGIVYEQAYFPHATPSTSPGHAAFSTGAEADYHGIIDNKWRNKNGELIAADDDTPESAAVFSPTGLYPYGKSAHYIMVDTISDQIMLAAQNKVFALSLKGRAAIMLAGKLGKPIWFDEQSGQFTSSTAYFKQLPSWLLTFNADHRFKEGTEIPWDLAYPAESPAYQLPRITDYSFTRMEPLTQSSIMLDPTDTDDPYKNFMFLPAANQLLLDLAQECIRAEFNPKESGTFLLWISLSSLDKVGHSFGPDSREYVDMIYHLDKQIGDFMATISQTINPEDVLFVFSADHGSMPIPELLAQEGLSLARRIDSKQLIDTINNALEKKFDLAHLILDIDMPDLYLDHQSLDKLSRGKKRQVIRVIKKMLRQQPGIKQVWTFNEIKNLCVKPGSIESFYKHQLFPDRSGDLIIQVFPYIYLNGNKYGTGHTIPYEFNTHVPLILYQPQSREHKRIFDHIWIQQFAGTLATILGIQKPSAATFSLLPM